MVSGLLWMWTERKQGNVLGTILDVKQEITETAKAKHLPVSNSSCTQDTVGISKVISSGEKSWLGIVSSCSGCTFTNGKAHDAGSIRTQENK